MSLKLKKLLVLGLELGFLEKLCIVKFLFFSHTKINKKRQQTETYSHGVNISVWWLSFGHFQCSYTKGPYVRFAVISDFLHGWKGSVNMFTKVKTLSSSKGKSYTNISTNH